MPWYLCSEWYYKSDFVIVQQEDIEEEARAELWRDELIEEIEQKVGSLRELEEAGKKEQLVKWSSLYVLRTNFMMLPSYVYTIYDFQFYTTWLFCLNSVLCCKTQISPSKCCLNELSQCQHLHCTESVLFLYLLLASHAMLF